MGPRGMDKMVVGPDGDREKLRKAMKSHEKPLTSL